MTTEVLIHEGNLGACDFSTCCQESEFCGVQKSEDDLFLAEAKVKKAIMAHKPIYSVQISGNFVP